MIAWQQSRTTVNAASDEEEAAAALHVEGELALLTAESTLPLQHFRTAANPQIRAEIKECCKLLRARNQ